MSVMGDSWCLTSACKRPPQTCTLLVLLRYVFFEELGDRALVVGLCSISRRLLVCIMSHRVRTVFHQRTNGLRIAVGTGFVKRGPIVLVFAVDKLRAATKDFFHGVRIIAVGSTKQIGDIHVVGDKQVIDRAMLNKQTTNLFVSALARVVNRVAISRGDTRPVLDQHFGHVVVPSICGEHKRCPLAVAGGAVNVGSTFEQDFHHSRLTSTRGNMQRREVLGITNGNEFGIFGQEMADCVCVAMEGRRENRMVRHARSFAGEESLTLAPECTTRRRTATEAVRNVYPSTPPDSPSTSSA